MKMIITCLTALILALSGLARAEDTLPIRLDLIVLRHANLAALETYRADQGPLMPADFLDDPAEGLINIATTGGLAASLDREWTLLRSSSAFIPLWQGSWTFDLARGESLRAVIAPEQALTEDMSLLGTLKVSLDKFLALETELALLRWRPAADALAVTELQPDPLLSQGDATDPLKPVIQEPWLPWGALSSARLERGESIDGIYLLNASQRSRSGQLNYLDHPVVSVLFRFVRLDRP